MWAANVSSSLSEKCAVCIPYMSSFKKLLDPFSQYTHTESWVGVHIMREMHCSFQQSFLKYLIRWCNTIWCMQKGLHAFVKNEKIGFNFFLYWEFVAKLQYMSLRNSQYLQFYPWLMPQIFRKCAKWNYIDCKEGIGFQLLQLRQVV